MADNNNGFSESSSNKIVTNVAGPKIIEFYRKKYFKKIIINFMFAFLQKHFYFTFILRCL